MAKKVDISIELISRYLANECSPAERKQVESWKSANEDEFLKYRTIWVDTGHIRDIPTSIDFDTDKAWTKVTAKIKKPEPKPLSIYTFLRLAAVLLVGFGLGYWITYESPSGLNSFSVAGTLGTVSLNDGSTVTLNQNSALSYSDFDPKHRTVNLRGEGFFDVKSDPKHPFRIQAGAVNIQVLGTSFNVKMDEEGSVSVEVYSGIVLVQKDTEKLELKAGEASFYHAGQNQLSKATQEKSGLTTFWKDKKLTFDDRYLSDVVSTLEKAYDVDILMMGDRLRNCRLHVAFDNSSLEEVFEVISLTLELDIRKEGDTYLISGKGCGN